MAVVCGSRGKLRPWQAAALLGVVSGVIVPRSLLDRRRPWQTAAAAGRQSWRPEAMAAGGQGGRRLLMVGGSRVRRRPCFRGDYHGQMAMAR